ncbi:TPA: hypothetical protein L9493_001012 [Klebsiella variicola subsp. variicola]|nr:hypothetical protein [Klebsiella variicola subsp. variicola]HBS3663199.1 hypothetical protein [Klebsiella variicola subsp. variicola]
MKTIREIELEIELAKTRQQVIQLSMMKMSADMTALDQVITNLNDELAKMKQE